MVITKDHIYLARESDRFNLLYPKFRTNLPVARVGKRNIALYGRTHERCQLFRGATAVAPMILCEGVEPYGARPS